MSSCVVMDGKLLGVSYVDENGVRQIKNRKSKLYVYEERGFKNVKHTISKEVKEATETVYIHNPESIVTDIKGWCSGIMKTFPGRLLGYDVNYEVKDSTWRYNKWAILKIKFAINSYGLSSGNIQKIQNDIWGMFIGAGIGGKLNYKYDKASHRLLWDNTMEILVSIPLVYGRTPLTRIENCCFNQLLCVYLSELGNIFGCMIAGYGGVVYILDKTCMKFWIGEVLDYDTYIANKASRNLKGLKSCRFYENIVNSNFRVVKTSESFKDFDVYIDREYKKSGYKNICLLTGGIGNELLVSLARR